MTRHHVTVALSGDGGDELFAGYNRYQLTQTIWRGLSLLPPAARRGLAPMPDRGFAGSLVTHCCRLLPARLPAQIGDKLHKFASVVSASRRRCALPAAGHALGARRRDAAASRSRRAFSGMRRSRRDMPDLLDRMQFLDLVTYLPDDILTKVDRASMAVALEARVPLIDHRVVEFSWRLPRYVEDPQRRKQMAAAAGALSPRAARH